MEVLISMKLHEVISYQGFSVMRVPGGWIYSQFDGGGCDDTVIVASRTFVPFTVTL